jgi:hypothetical protein
MEASGVINNSSDITSAKEYRYSLTMMLGRPQRRCRCFLRTENLLLSNQPDALFIFNLFRQSLLHVSDTFTAHHQEVFTVYVQQLSDSGWSILTRPAASHLKYNTYQLLYIYSEYLLMMGNKHARNM